MAAPKTNITQQDGQLGASSPSGRRPVIVCGASTGGPTAGDKLTALAAYQSPTALAALYLKGPLVEACKYHLSLGTPVVPVRVLADATGTCSAVDNTHMTAQGSVGSINSSHNTPTKSRNVKVYFSLGGVVGTGPITYAVSYDGGTSYGVPTALGTATHITLSALGDVQLDLTVDDITTANYLTFTTTAVLAGTDDYVDTDIASTIAMSGGCDDTYEILIEFQNAGTLGTTGLLYKYSRDDGRGGMSQSYALGTDLAITVPGTGGTIIILETGKAVVAGNYVRVTMNAPGWDAAAMQDALDMVETYQGDWEQIHLVGSCDTTTFAALDTLLNALPDEKAKDCYGVVSFRKPQYGSDETEAQYLAAFDTWRDSCTSTLGYVCASMGSIQVVTSGISYRREAGFPVAAKIASVAEQINVAQRRAPGGSLTGCSFGVSQSGLADHDEYISPGGDNLQAITVRTWPDLTGVYVTWPNTMAAKGSDFGVVTRRRVMNAALKTARTYCADLTAQNLYLDLTTGYLEAFERDRLNREATGLVEQSTKGKCSAVQVAFAPDDNLKTNPPGPLNATLAIQPLGEVHDVNLLATFTATIRP